MTTQTTKPNTLKQMLAAAGVADYELHTPETRDDARIQCRAHHRQTTQSATLYTTVDERANDRVRVMIAQHGLPATIEFSGLYGRHMVTGTPGEHRGYLIVWHGAVRRVR